MCNQLVCVIYKLWFCCITTPKKKWCVKQVLSSEQIVKFPSHGFIKTCELTWIINQSFLSHTGSEWQQLSSQSPWTSSSLNCRMTWRKPWTPWCARSVKASTSTLMHIMIINLTSSRVQHYSYCSCVVYFWLSGVSFVCSGGLRWIETLLKPASAPNATVAIAPRRETFGLSPACWAYALPTLLAWKERCMILQVINVFYLLV